MEEQLQSGAYRCIPGLIILDQAWVIGDIGLRTVCDLTCSGMQRAVVISSRDVSRDSLECFSAK